MFTGLVEAAGRILKVGRAGGAGRLEIAAPFAPELSEGESVSVNGVCLTVVASSDRSFTADAVERTMTLTTLGRLSAGDRVNLERALKVGDRIGGHMVTGHVDGVATVVRVERTANGRDITLDLTRTAMRHVAERGSIAVDGISLTVAAARGTSVTCSLIPETLASTTAGEYRTGTRVNVETDVAAKYQESIGRDAEASDEGGLTIDRLRELGFTE